MKGLINWILLGFFGIYFVTSVISLVRRIRRGNKVHKFRMMIIDTYPFDVYETLPPFEEMCEDGLELRIENYIENINDFKEYQSSK